MLHFDFYQGNPARTLVMLHGLFGSAKNLAALAKKLTNAARIYAYDARNHGQSHHTATHNLDELVDDLGEFIGAHGIDKPILLGHSMGGFTAMAYCLRQAARVKALVVLDIAPRSYPAGHEQEIAAQKMEIGEFASRREIDEAMAKVLPDKTLRQFIQMNIARDETGRYVWTNNVEAIGKSRSRTVFPPYESPLFAGPVLAIRGLRSDYVTAADVEAMRVAFPRLELIDIPDGEHWFHYTHLDRVSESINTFLNLL